MELFRKIKTYTLLVSLLYVVMGVIMLLNPGFILDAVNYIVGVLVLFYGVIYIAKFLSKNSFNTLSKFGLLAGLLCITFGVYILVNPTLLSSIIPFAAGMLLLVDGLSKLKDAMAFKKSGYKYWWIGLIISLLFIGSGIYMILNAFNVSKLVVRAIGLILIADALSDLWSHLCYKKYPGKKETKKEIEDIKEANIVEVTEK